MKIKYKKKRLKNNLIYGIIWIIWSLITIYVSPNNYFNYGFLVLGSLYLGTYFYENKNQYLTLDKNTITQHKLIPKKITISEIIQIKQFAGDYILKTNTTEMNINKDFIDKASLAELTAFFDGLKLES